MEVKNYGILMMNKQQNCEGGCSNYKNIIIIALQDVKK